MVGLLAGGHSGVPRYAQSLARALDEISREFTELRLSLITTEAGAEAVGARTIEVRPLSVRWGRLNRGLGRIVAEQLAARSAETDLLYFFDLTGPVLAQQRPFVATAHDLSHLHSFGRFRQLHKRRLIPWAARHARALVAISAFTKDELVQHLRVPAEKIRVIRSGPGMMMRPETPIPATVPGGPFVLFVGNLTESKNLPLLIRAYTRANIDAALVLLGRPLERYGDIVAEIARSSRRARIHVIHDATDNEVDHFYRAATALVLPSLYEGFGLTALEAMQRSCPVLASDIPAIREISGGGAELLPPYDESAWATALERLFADAAFRDELRARGAETVARYSRSQTAREVRLLMRSVDLTNPKLVPHHP